MSGYDIGLTCGHRVNYSVLPYMNDLVICIRCDDAVQVCDGGLRKSSQLPRKKYTLDCTECKYRRATNKRDQVYTLAETHVRKWGHAVDILGRTGVQMDTLRHDRFVT